MRTWENTKTRHGTASGFRLHFELGERPCDPCYMAKQKYDKRYRSVPDRVIVSRKRAAAQMAAYGRLARLYPDIYRAFYEQELTERELPSGGQS